MSRSKHTDFNVSSACILVEASEESVLAMQSLKSIAESLLRQASAKTIFSKVQPSPSQSSQTNACRLFFKINGVPRGPKFEFLHDKTNSCSQVITHNYGDARTSIPIRLN